MIVSESVFNKIPEIQFTYLNEQESNIFSKPDVITVIENQGSYIIEHSDIEYLSENSSISLIEAYKSVLKTNDLLNENIKVIVNDYDVILDPSICKIYENYVVRPISENNEIYQILESLISEKERNRLKNSRFRKIVYRDGVPVYKDSSLYQRLINSNKNRLKDVNDLLRWNTRDDGRKYGSFEQRWKDGMNAELNLKRYLELKDKAKKMAKQGKRLSSTDSFELNVLRNGLKSHAQSISDDKSKQYLYKVRGRMLKKGYEEEKEREAEQARRKEAEWASINIAKAEDFHKLRQKIRDEEIKKKIEEKEKARREEEKIRKRKEELEEIKRKQEEEIQRAKEELARAEEKLRSKQYPIPVKNTTRLPSVPGQKSRDNNYIEVEWEQPKNKPINTGKTYDKEANQYVIINHDDIDDNYKLHDEEKSDSSKASNVEEKAQKIMNSKDPNVLAKAIASFRNIYYKFMMKVKKSKDSKEVSWYKKLAAKVLGWIDRLASKLQLLVDRRKGSEMKKEELDRYQSDMKRFNRQSTRLSQ